MTQTEREADVVLVGGGLAGLAAAACLARKGQQVVVVEKGDAVGGRARTRTLDGFSFNLGAHALYRAGKGAAVLRELGVEPEGGVPAGEGGFAVRAGVLHTLPIGFVSLLTTGLLRPREKLETARFFASLRRMDTGRLDTVTLAEWLRAHVSSPVVGELVASAVRVSSYSDDLDRMSAGAAFAQLRRAGSGVLYLDGGWQTLVDGLRGVAEAAGARILTRRSAVAVARDPAVRGVRLDDGQTLRAHAVVLCGSPGVAADLLADGEPTVVRDWAEEAIPVRAACLDVALDRLPRPERTFALGIDAPLYASVHSAVARLAPEGGALIHLLRYGGLGGESGAHREQELAALLDALQPGWRGHVVRQRFVPDLVVTSALVTAEKGGLAGRPGPAVPDVPGLYVAGDWVGPDGMLAVASARHAAFAILDSTADAYELG